MTTQPQWHQLFDMTGQMLQAAKNEDWAQLNELQQVRDQLMTTLPDATAADTTLLQKILYLNQNLENLSSERRDRLAGKLQQGQKKRLGITAYQAVTGQRH